MKAGDLQPLRIVRSSLAHPLAKRAPSAATLSWTASEGKGGIFVSNDVLAFSLTDDT